MYFDSFVNDNTIEEIYETQPLDNTSFEFAEFFPNGVTSINYPSNPYELFLFANQYYQTDYQAKLFKYVNEYKNISPENYSYKLHMNDYQSVINNNAILSNSSYFSRSHNYYGENLLPNDPILINGFDNYVKNLIDNNKFVVLHIYKYNQNNNNHFAQYHSVIAYYYDNLGIHANFGWNQQNSRDIVLSLNDWYIWYAGYFDVSNIIHKHSNNYKVNGAHYCGCRVHEHDYTESYTYYSSTQHKALCDCSDYQLKPHVISQNSIINIGTHLYGTCLYNNSSIDLGVGGGGLIGPNNYNDLLVTNNGSYILENGIIILVDDDIEAYNDGTLDFHYKNDEII